MEYKYRLDELLKLIPHQHYRKVCNDLEQLLDISRTHFNRIRAFTIDTHKTLNSDQMLTICEYFQISLDTFVNKPGEDQEPFTASNLSSVLDRLATASNL